MAALQLLVAPILAVLLTLWAAAMALAAEVEAEFPRILADRRPAVAGPLELTRALHLAHLTLLILAGAVAGSAVAWWAFPPPGNVMRLLAAVVLVWLVGDLLPRIVAAIGPELGRPARRLALRTLPPLRPLFSVVAWVERRVGREPDMSEASASASQARLHVERDMLGGVFALRETTVAEVMTPRIDIVAVDMAMSREEAVATLRSSEHARLLVYEGDPDNIAGVLYAKDMLALLGTSASEGDDRSWTSLIRPAAFVPEGKTLDRQLRDFQRGPGHLAVVVDEFGGTSGIVTLEDILEQIVGEIQDEYDTDEVAPVQRLDEGLWRVQGGVGLTELEGVLNHRFSRDDVSTVGGLVLAELGRVPRPGEQLALDEYDVTVDQVARRRVRRVTIRRRATAAADAGTGP